MTFPQRFTDLWFQENVPPLTFRELLTLQDELHRRNWTETEINTRVLIHRKAL